MQFKGLWYFLLQECYPYLSPFLASPYNKTKEERGKKEANFHSFARQGISAVDFDNKVNYQIATFRLCLTFLISLLSILWFFPKRFYGNQFQGIYLVSATKTGCLTVHDFESLYLQTNETGDYCTSCSVLQLVCLRFFFFLFYASQEKQCACFYTVYISLNREHLSILIAKVPSFY